MDEKFYIDQAPENDKDTERSSEHLDQILHIAEADVNHFFDVVFSATQVIQAILPNAVSIGGSAIYAYTQYRDSIDADHVIRDRDKNWSKIKA